MVASSQYVEHITRTFDQAAAANRAVPDRHGSTVVLPPETANEVLITGDLHGHRRNFNMIRRLAALDDNPRRHLVLQEVCHGGPTYLQSGGCMSHTVLEDVAALKVKYPERVHFLLGNHELAEMSDFPIQKNRQLLNLLFRLGLRQMYGPAAEEVRQAALRFLWTCPLAIRLPHGVLLSHSLPERTDINGFDATALQRDLRPEDATETSDVFRMVWGRDYRRENVQAFCQLLGTRLLITGHEPCTEGFVAPNDLQVVLDCCGDKPAYVCLPTDRELSHAEVVAMVRILGE